MNMQKHNPDYKLISVTINNLEFVYGETNTGDNPGLEIYYFNDNTHAAGHYYSRRYTANKIPGIYSFLYRRLKALTPYCATGNRLTMDALEYHDIANLQGRYKTYAS
jgi:hypothetical protein